MDSNLHLKPFQFLHPCKSVFFILACLLFVLPSCDELPCVEKKSPALRIAVFRDSASVLLPASVSFKKLSARFGSEVYSSENEFFKAANRSPARRLTIPLTPASDSLLLIISDSLFTDSLFMDFRKENLYVSAACGYTPVKYDLKIRYLKSKRFSRARLLQNKADTNSVTDHVQIIF